MMIIVTGSPMGKQYFNFFYFARKNWGTKNLAGDPLPDPNIKKDMSGVLGYTEYNFNFLHVDSK